MSEAVAIDGIAIPQDGFFEGFESEDGDLVFSEALFSVKADGLGDTLDGGCGVLVIIEAGGVAANDFGESDGLVAEWRISGSGDFAGVATVFVEDEAAVGFFEPFDGFEVPAVDELVFVVENVEIAAGSLHDVSEEVEVVGGEILGFVDDDVFELIIVTETAEQKVGEFVGGGIFFATGFGVELVEVGEGNVGELGGEIVFEVLDDEFIETEKENVGIFWQTSGTF